MKNGILWYVKKLHKIQILVFTNVLLGHTAELSVATKPKILSERFADL